jgi:hypothetical protein
MNMTESSLAACWNAAWSGPIDEPEEIPMNVSAVVSSAVSNYQPPTSQPAVAPQASSTSLPNDTVSLSSAAQKGGGDVDHDGDSH